MSIFNKVNGTNREGWSLNVKVNGTWHHANQYVKQNGKWHESHHAMYTPDDITSFRLIYQRCSKIKTHPIFPNLGVNYDLPVAVSVSGSVDNDTKEKGFVFEYSNYEPEKEGILMYEGRLYAVLKSGELIDVSQCGFGEHRVTSNIPEHEYVWYTNRLNDLTITIEGQISYETYGFYISGWNDLFNRDEFLNKDNTFPEESNKNYLRVNSYIMNPYDKRDEKFVSFASIGIVRDMHTQEINMVGSHGVLDHTIYSIKVNDIVKPFEINVYN